MGWKRSFILGSDRQVSNHFVVLSGCSGGGKSTLLRELRRRGYATVEEPGRRIIKDEAEKGGSALPWVDLQAFARRAMEVAKADLQQAGSLPGWVFFDRGLVDAVTALNHITLDPAAERMAVTYRYHKTVFLTPPWPEIHIPDAELKLSWGKRSPNMSALRSHIPSLGIASSFVRK